MIHKLSTFKYVYIVQCILVCLPKFVNQLFYRSSMNMTIKFEIPATNGTSGMFVAARVDRGGCGVNKAGGVFFFVFPNTSTFIVSSDLSESLWQAK